MSYKYISEVALFAVEILGKDGGIKLCYDSIWVVNENELSESERKISNEFGLGGEAKLFIIEIGKKGTPITYIDIKIAFTKLESLEKKDENHVFFEGVEKLSDGKYMLNWGS